MLSSLSPSPRAVLRLGAISLIVAGVLSLLVGAWALTSALGEPELAPSQGEDVAIPAAGTWGGSVTVYVDRPVEDGPGRLGCEVVEADGDIASGTRMEAFTFALADSVHVHGVTWHPLTEIDLASQPATLRCDGDLLSTAAVSAPSTFGGLSLLVAVAALGFAPVALVLGVVVLVLLRGSTRTPARRVWPS